MKPTNTVIETDPSRRTFLKNTGKSAAAAGLMGAATAPGFAQGASPGDDTIKVALVGCGGRGTGAAFNALKTSGPTKLWAVADVFEHRLESSLKSISAQFPKQVEVPPERRFLGMDAYQSAIDLLGEADVVLLTTPPAFRPIHLEYAVNHGCNVFMEKSFAVDGPGIRRVLRAGEAADRKNLKIAGGLMSRHSPPLEEAIRRIHDGAIGDIITCWAYREHGPVGFKPKQSGMSELAHQIANYSNFTWLNGSFIVDWLIHNIDVCCWVKNAWPVSAQGQGGRQVRSQPDQMYDHFAVEYRFADGTRMFAQGRHIPNTWNHFGDVIHGTTGSATLGEGVSKPRICRGHDEKVENVIWRHKGTAKNAYQHEHDLFFEAIRQNNPYNETDRCARAAMTAIMGRMAAESGREVTFEEALASDHELAPGLDACTWASDAPVRPDADNQYPIPNPGQGNPI
ncbi:MAG: streptomycin biosynthesis protein StrI [Roseibacillus sp.]|jgi:predicted dehydrogenase|nr:streptomycin biosynthesis protein StrI [Roseibacillus sp.]MBP34377.1 streptomycin biosynthesis protein StrI [Roseibacillus sp.]MCP4729077.1 Gfo/Idh/MocA family oxidoreductase [Roseibacillus sp.]MDP7307344.1 Gfo/Idh/MocA family oxidoreductase [Roseibacillus sp.]HJM62127.1 Gfo/Idh/MocA family oxidoreductase [Roseibacillus sp.]|tara:strand:- start:15577 stop:16938 length:1362 start_codon:yes stop_codon:yes gene_type:complete